MRRHSIIARLGPTDTSQIRVQERGSEVTELRFIDSDGRLGFGLGQMIDQLGDLSIRPTNTALDLGLLAATVTAADTRISRASESQDSWTREIDLYVPVVNLELWENESTLIIRMLNFLTGDRWRIFFRARHRDYQQIIKPETEQGRPTFDSLCLFSGGLDSFVGAIDLLADGANPLFVSHYWDTSTSSQKICAERLGSVYGDLATRHVRARVGFPDSLIQGSEPEKTTRGRSFLFFALAALAASGLDRDMTVYVPENGLIVLNVPLDPLRIGAWSTRTTHPFYIARWADLSRHLGIAISWQNPYRFRTKGEMLSECANKAFLRSHLETTVSCSSITKARWKGLAPQHCGHCVPCLIRRSAIKHAFGNDPTPYTLVNLSAQTLNAKRSEGENVRSFQLMARRLAQRPELAQILIRKPGPLSDYSDQEIADYAAVFARGIAEVEAVLSGVAVRPL